MRVSFRYLTLTILTALFMAFGSLASPSSFIDSAIADDGKAALKLAPKSTTGVISINIERVKSSPAYAAFMGMASKDPEFAKALQMAKDDFGLDLEKDISSLVIVLPSNVVEGQFLVVANGKFDQKKISAKALAEGGKESTVAGQTVIQGMDGDAAIAFVGSHAMMGTSAMVSAALSDGGAVGAGISKLIGSVDASKDVWVALEVPAALKGLDPSLADINNLAASLDLSSGIGLKLAVGTTSDDKAKGLVEMANMGIGQAAKDPSVAAMGLAAAIGRTKVSQSGSVINVDISVNSAEVDTIQKMLGGMMP
jgi:hypothetical protein